MKQQLICMSALAVGISCATANAQSSPAAVLRLELEKSVPMKKGAAVKAKTLDAFFQNSQLIFPAGTEVSGNVVNVLPQSRSVRMNARMRGDFTPLHRAVLNFDHAIAPDGTPIPLDAMAAEQGSEILRFQPKHSEKRSVPGQLWARAKDQLSATVHSVTDPDKAQRARKFLYSQLPYHPESVEKGTQYEIALKSPVSVPEHMLSSSRAPSESKLDDATTLHARLVDELTSRTAKQGDPVSAVVTEPKLSADHTVEVPQGAMLRGHVLQAHAARKLGHNGDLRFTFDRIEFPGGAKQPVVGVASAVDAPSSTNIDLDVEGGAKAQTNKGMLLPLALGLLSTSALTEDEASLGHAATSSNGFGLIGRAIAIGTGSNIFGGVLGATATGRMVYTRFLAHGKDVVFPPNTGIEIEVGPVHKRALESR